MDKETLDRARENRNAYMREYNIKYRLENKEKLSIQRKKWCENNKDKIKEYNLKYWSKKTLV